MTIQTAALEDATYNALWVEGKKEGEVTFTKDAGANTGLMGLESMDEGTVSTEGESSDTPAQSLADVMKEVACAESKAEEADKTVTVAMDVQPVNTNSGELAEETQTAIEKIKEQSGSGSDEKVKDDLLTIEVQKTTAPTSGSGEVTTEKLTDIGRVVEIPLQYNMTGRYQPRIFRFHDNVAAAFARLATRPVSGFRDGTYFVSGVGASAVIYIYTEKFSTYSITTTETPTHTVMFETNGGSAIETVTIEDQQTIDPPTAPTKNSGDAMISYVFDGWYSSSDFSTVYDFSTKVTKDLTLYAKWREIVVYTITFNPNEGTVSPTNGITNAEGKLATLPTPTRGGYIFNGWYDAQTGGSRVTADTVFTENSTVYARWTKTGGSNTPGSVYSGSSSSSDSDDTRYKVTTGETQHGTVSVSSTSTSSGTKVTITVKPDTGYAVDTVTVTGANGRNVAVTKVNDTTYTYIQPGMDVKTDVTFKAAQAAPASTAEVFAPYSDLDASGWYADGVRYALENGIMSGYGNGKFGPGDTTSRAMIAQILYNLEGKPAYSGMLTYTDVDADDWYAAAIRWASAEGILDGYGNHLFGPNDVLTREQLVTILYRYAKSKGVDVSGQTSLTGYSDSASVSGWAEDAMQWAVAAGVVTGKGDGILDPKGNATRSEIATIMMRYCENIAK